MRFNLDLDRIWDLNMVMIVTNISFSFIYLLLFTYDLGYLSVKANYCFKNKKQK